MEQEINSNKEETFNPEEASMDKPPKPKRRVFKAIFLSLLLIALVGAAAAFYYYNKLFGETLPPLSEDLILKIPPYTKLTGIADLLESEKVISDKATFLWTAEQMSFKGKAGKFKIPKSTRSNYELVKVLRGQQLGIKLTFHNMRKKEQLAGRVAPLIQDDSVTIANLLNDENYLDQYGYNPQTIMSLFIPNTYEIYWTYDGMDFVERMIEEHKKFWDQDGRRAKAEELGLSPTEVYTLASIVETESQYQPERPRIAGVYINRLQKGWKLEADPTVVFANGDFTLRRVLFRHLEIDSPYNTYMYEGLPPGPIYMASISSIDAVLNYEKHNYMFFCAKPYVAGEPNTHAFAETGAGHGRNVSKWKKFLRTLSR